MLPDVGDRIHGWRIVAEIGAGGTARVFRVEADDGRRAALKILAGRIGSGEARLAREARALAALRHPHIVELLDILPLEHGPGLLLELVEGPSLAAWLRGRGPLDEATVRALFDPLLAAVAHAHALGWVHRDLKPANVLLTAGHRGARASSDRPVPKVADFGIARLREPGDRLTQAGAVLGTPGYMAPEQRRAPADVDGRADVFSLGAILFELCCGRPAFAGSDPLAVLDRAAHGAFPDPRLLRPDLPEPMLVAIHGALQPDPDRRIGDCATLRHVVEGAVSWATPARVVAAPTWTPDLPPAPPPAAPPPPGRAAAMQRIAALLTDHALVTVIGPGGIGKTTLALACVADQPDAVVVDLSTARDVAAIAEAVARALGLEVRAEGPDALVERIGQILARRPRTLLVLDTFERVVDCAASTVGRWVAAAPRARFLATSREALELPAEVTVPLGPLAPDDAVEVLCAAAVALGGAPGPDSTPWRALAEAAEGIPLALELAAAAAARLGVEQALRGLGDRGRWQRRDGPERHRTLGDLLDWSWSMLSGAEASAVAQLSVFRGGFTPSAAERVLGLPPDAPPPAAVLRELRRKQLIHSAPSAASPGTVRLSMFAHVREYAAERLVEQGDAEATVARYVRWASELGSPEVYESFLREGGDRRVRALVAELPDLRAALAHASAAHPDAVPGITIALGLALERTGPFDPALAAGALPHARDRWQRSTLVQQRAWAAICCGRGEEAERILDEHLGAGDGDPALLARLLNTRGSSLVVQGRHAEGEAAFREALDAAGDDPLLQGKILFNLATTAAATRRLPEADELAARARERLREGRASELELARLRQLEAMLGAVHGRLGEAIEHGGRVRRTFRRLGLPRQEVVGAVTMAEHLLMLGRDDEARAVLAPARQRSIELGLASQEISAELALAHLDWRAGDGDSARRRLEDALELAGSIGSPLRVGWVLARTARLALSDGDHERAIALLSRIDERRATVPQRAALLHARAGAGEIDSADGEVLALIPEIEATTSYWREQAWLDLAWVAHLSGDRERAAGWLARAEADVGALRLPRGAPLRDLVEALAREVRPPAR